MAVTIQRYKLQGGYDGQVNEWTVEDWGTTIPDERLWCKASDVAKLEADHLAEVDRAVAEALKNQDALHTRYLVVLHNEIEKRQCGTCLEYHPLASMCPPHEVRVSGLEWFNQHVDRHKKKIAALAAEKMADSERLHGWIDIYRGQVKEVERQLAEEMATVAALTAERDRLREEVYQQNSRIGLLSRNMERSIDERDGEIKRLRACLQMAVDWEEPDKGPFGERPDWFLQAQTILQPKGEQ